MRLTLVVNGESVSIGSQRAKKVRALINELSKLCDIKVTEICGGLPNFETEIEVEIYGKKEPDIPITGT